MLLDTTFLVDLQRELAGARPGRATRFLEDYPDEVASISLITWMEFAEGYSSKERENCQMFLSRFSLVLPDQSIAWRASRIARELRAKGARVGDHDVWIAATAQERGLRLITRNSRHFHRIAGLSVQTY